ncbi:unnamed protein product [Angiostrongylus costaricensis]|uniref:DRIM domain-containing protein n=1 Tax=Angiostrongylus costaricensis TaxID=334426 RepID=A0A0R3Q0S4_ANGCS|nr:unnamed protein product [Angiostrongylus costaricensis]
MELLLKNLHDPECKSTEPFCELLTALIRDLKDDCREDIWNVLEALINVLGQVVEQAYRVQDDRLTEGCAELFFHVPRGVAGAFHSTANEKICSIISGILHLPNADVREYGVTILEMFVQLLVQYVRKGVEADLSPLEVALLNMLEDLNSMELVNCMARLLRLCFVQRKWVNMFSSNTKLLSVITKLLSSSFFEINSVFIEFLSECVLKVFPSSEWGHSIGCMCSTLVFKTGDLSAVFNFFNNAINLVYFDEHLMPVVGKFSAVVFEKEHGFVEHLLNLYSTVCLNKRPLKDIVCGDVNNVIEYLKNLIRGKDYSLETSQTALIAVSSLFRVDQSRLGEIDICQVEEFVRVALAQFFVPFTKLWSSMYGFLESFARGMDIDEFWSVITEVFNQVNAGCRDQYPSPSAASILPLCDKNDRADYYSVRTQVLKFIDSVWDLGQRRTRILSPILLGIYEIEYLPFITERITSWQQRLPETSILGTDSQKNEYSEKRDQYLTVTKTLCAFLDIYAKFTDAKSVYLEPKIRDMYNHLLISGNDMVQKSVMACIFSYKDKALLPYQENFERLLNEKLFREQLVLFSINENEGNSIIHLDHRRAVMYILLRLLYGKLWAHTKRNVVESRRAAIFRYLGGCRPDELLDFLKILFGPILEVIGAVEMDFNKMEALCSDEQTLFKMDFIGIKRCVV